MRIGAFKLRSIRSPGITVPAAARPSVTRAPAEHGGGIDLVTRPLLIEGDREKLLVDAGPRSLEESLNRAGVDPRAIDMVVLTHLHADHAGGFWRRDRTRWGDVRVVVSQQALDLQRQAAEEGSTAAMELLASIEGIVEPLAGSCGNFAPGIGWGITHGHTPGMLTLRIEGPEGILIAAADLLPTVSHLRLGGSDLHDVDPALFDIEKRALIEEAVRLNGWIFLYHDTRRAAIRIGGTPDRPFVREEMRFE